MKLLVSTVLIASIAVLFIDSVNCTGQRMICTVPDKNPNGEREESICTLDYKNINATIRKIMEQDLNYVAPMVEREERRKFKIAMEEQRVIMSRAISELLERIIKLEEIAAGANQSSPLILPGITELDIVRYDGRIYIPWLCEKVDMATAIAKCKQFGGELANIYNQIHMDNIMTFIRDNKLGERRYKDFLLGMTYDPMNQILRLRNGTAVSQTDFRWSYHHPYLGKKYRKYRNVYVVIEKGLTVPFQYFMNLKESKSYGVLCEI
uniref:uncharacterized protein LOC120328448 isoform X1 n=1 Tax=Styela clava TaxID=7725 RepID=UPI0019396A57|nr:uncharacterized protein LOC120328448 isoform X1 [Styela clava]